MGAEYFVTDDFRFGANRWEEKVVRSHAGRFSWHGPAEVRAPVNFSVVLHQQTVTRLRPNGSVDRTFGRGGKWTVPAGTIGRFSELVV